MLILVSMLGSLRDARGRPTLRVKILAVALVLGLVALVAPLVVPVVQRLFEVFAHVLF